MIDCKPQLPQEKRPIYIIGAVYGQTPPLVNVCRKPGEWQSFDIHFTSPAFKDEKLVKPGFITVLHNGVFIHNRTEIL